MVFNSIEFVLFFVIVSILLLMTNSKFFESILAREKLFSLRHSVLLASSYIFYGWWDFRFTVLMFFLTAVSYFCALALESRKKKIYLSIAVVVPLIVLFTFKYLNFFLDSFTKAFGVKNLRTLRIILPVGISFYTFQSLSYSIDVWRGKIKAEKSFLKVALYISFFPQLVAGPIVKASSFIPQLYEDRNVSLNNFAKGIQLFLFGLFKKVVMADNLSVCVDTVFAFPGQYHAVSLIFAVVAYSIQIYCDFSGYSDMAIGCAKCLGYDLERNFNLPYISRNVKEFWKRWHISLSNWLMEYLYFSIGGNRKGIKRTSINLMVTMLLGGLWHGANWTYVVWGLLHGLMLCGHRVWQKLMKHGKDHEGSLLGNAASVCATYMLVCFCWIFFRADSFANASAVLKGIFSWQDGMVYVSSWTVISIVLLISATFSACLKSARTGKVTEGYYISVRLDTVKGMTMLFVLTGLILILAYTGSNPFIYFQF